MAFFHEQILKLQNNHSVQNFMKINNLHALNHDRNINIASHQKNVIVKNFVFDIDPRKRETTKEDRIYTLGGVSVAGSRAADDRRARFLSAPAFFISGFTYFFPFCICYGFCFRR